MIAVGGPRDEVTVATRCGRVLGMNVGLIDLLGWFVFYGALTCYYCLRLVDTRIREEARWNASMIDQPFENSLLKMLDSKRGTTAERSGCYTYLRLF